MKKFPKHLEGRALELAQELAEGTRGRAFKTERDGQAVIVERVVMAPLGGSGIWYEVTDVAVGHKFKCSEGFLRDELTEMETIAWAARGSGSKTSGSKRGPTSTR